MPKISELQFATEIVDSATYLFGVVPDATSVTGYKAVRFQAALLHGSDGTDGLNGSAWYSSSGSPSTELGVDGDYYLNTSTGDIIKKTLGTWEVVCNIQGSGSGGEISGVGGLNIYLQSTYGGF